MSQQVPQLIQQIGSRTRLAEEVSPQVAANAVKGQLQGAEQQARSAEHLMHSAVLGALQEELEGQTAARRSLDPGHRTPPNPLALEVLGQHPEISQNYIANRAARAGVPLPMQPQSGLSATQAAQMADLASVRAGSAQPANG